MLSIFRTNQFVANILLIFYVLLLRGAAFILPPQLAANTPGSILSEVLFKYVSPQSSGGLILAMLLVFFQAILINLCVSRYRMAKELSLFPGLFYILIASAIPEFLYLSPPLLANTFYILALFEIFGIYKKHNCASQIFNTGFWIALGSLFYFSYITFIIMALIALATLRAFKIKEAVMLLIGFSVPMILTIVYSFLTDQLPHLGEALLGNRLEEGDGSLISPSSVEQYIKLSFFALLTIIALFNFNRYQFKKNIHVQKNISLLYWCLLLSAITLLVQSHAQFDHLLVLAVPLGIFLSFNFLRLQPALAEALHLILLAAILLLQFRPLLGF